MQPCLSIPDFVDCSATENEPKNLKEDFMSAAQVPDLSSSREMPKTIAYMALGVSVLTVVLLGMYVYRSSKPRPEIKQLKEAQAATNENVKELEGKLKDVSISVAAIEETLRSDRQQALLLDLKRSLVVLQEVGKQAPPSLKPKIKAIEQELGRLTDEVAKPTPKKRLEIRSVR
jgi:VCBS repeat-containing protein